MRRRLGVIVLAALMFGTLSVMRPPVAAAGPGPVDYIVCLYDERDPFACDSPIADPPPIDPGQVPPVDPGDIPPIDPGSVPSIGSGSDVLNPAFLLLCRRGVYPFEAFCILAKDGLLGPKLHAARAYLVSEKPRGHAQTAQRIIEGTRGCLEAGDPSEAGTLQCVALRILDEG